MPKLQWVIVLAASFAQGQSSLPAASNNSASQKTNFSEDDLFPLNRLGDKVGWVRGVLKRIDPIYDQLVIHTFGGHDIRIEFDGRTKILPESSHARLTSITAGSVVSIDTVTSEGKLFARSVRTSTSNSAELNGRVMRYDPAKSQLILRDPISPETVSLRITPNTAVVRGGKATSAQTLSSGMLVHVWFSATQSTAKEVEILAERGGSYTFEGRIIAVDRHSRVLSLSNDTDQSLRELTFGVLDDSSLALLREGVEVSIQAEFDGDHYNVRTVALIPQNP